MGELVYALARNDAHDLRQENEVDVAIDEAAAWLGCRSLAEGLRDAGLVAAPFRFKVHIRAQPGRMRQQLPDRDRATGEIGQIAGDSIVQPQPPLLDEQHHGRRGYDDLRQRCSVEYRVGLHRPLFGDKTAAAVSLVVENPVAAANQQYGAGHRLRLECVFDDPVEHRRTSPLGREGRERAQQSKRNDACHAVESNSGVPASESSDPAGRCL